MKIFSYKFVTPVEIGAQRILKYLKSRSERDWIPAFAGMTENAFSDFSRDHRAKGLNF